MTGSEALIKILLRCPEELRMTAQGRENPLFTGKKLKLSRLKQLLNIRGHCIGFGMRPIIGCVNLGSSLSLSELHFLQL